MSDLLSTKELAEAIGVSESSIKRWIDQGRIPSSRTAGGHRRVPRDAALRFVRDEGLAVVRPDRLRMAGTRGTRGKEAAAVETELLGLLLEGAQPEARALLMGLYLDGMPVAAIVDGPVRSAMRRLGELWRHDPDGVFVEHRATDLCVRILSEIRALFPPPKGPSAVGGAVPGDPYLLPSMAAAAVLAAEGFDAVNLGPELPVASLERAVARHRPALVWLSASVAADRERLGRELAGFARRAARDEVSVAVGGRAAAELGLPALPNLHVGGSMAELAAFARGIAATRYSRSGTTRGGETV